MGRLIFLGESVMLFSEIYKTVFWVIINIAWSFSSSSAATVSFYLFTSFLDSVDHMLQYLDGVYSCITG